MTKSSYIPTSAEIIKRVLPKRPTINMVALPSTAFQLTRRQLLHWAAN